MTKERVLTVLLILVIIFSVNRVLKVNEISNSNEQLYKSVNALNDTIVVKNNKIGEALYEKTTLNLDLNTIKSANSGLKTDIENLSRKDRKNLDRINELSVTISQLRDSLKQGKVTQINDSTYAYIYKDSTEFKNYESELYFTSKSRPYNFDYRIINDEVYFKIVLFEKDGYVMAKSDNPLVTFNSINSYKIPVKPFKQKRFGLGFSTGLTMNSSFGVSPYIGIGLNYNLIPLF